MKIGRNDKYYCGSGQKYKKCCLKKENKMNNKTTLYDGMKKCMSFRKMKLAERGIFINIPTPVVMDDKKYWAVWNRIYFRLNIKETFHEFIVWLLGESIGFDWFQKESIKKHVLRDWIGDYFQWQQTNLCDENKVGDLWAYAPDGFVQALICLAFDVFLLKQTNNLPESYIKRLKDPKQFQGVRYEISVASIFARMGFHLQFLDDEKNDSEHCEFYVKNDKGDIVTAVEVKSKHREGVLNFPGEKPSEIKVFRQQLDGLFKKARRQNPGNMPFIIFMDINAPQEITNEGLEKSWIQEMMRMVGSRETSKESPDSVNGVIFTNYSYHYQEKNQAISGENCMAISMYCKYEINNTQNFWNLLHVAVGNYGSVPNLDVEYGE